MAFVLPSSSSLAFLEVELDLDVGVDVGGRNGWWTGHATAEKERVGREEG